MGDENVGWEMSILRALKFLMATVSFAAQGFGDGKSARATATDLLPDR